MSKINTEATVLNAYVTEYVGAYLLAVTIIVQWLYNTYGGR